MSKRFLRWIEVWIADNVASGSGGDVEPFAVRAARLSEKLLADAASQGFRQAEIDEEAAKIAGLVEAKLVAKKEFDLSAFGAAPED